ncbi:unnamed protein product, partial [Adineta steineri]
DLYDVSRVKMFFRVCVIKATAPLSVDTLPATVRKNIQDIVASATLTGHAAPDVQFVLINNMIDAIFQVRLRTTQDDDFGSSIS